MRNRNARPSFAPVLASALIALVGLGSLWIAHKTGLIDAGATALMGLLALKAVGDLP
jgi:hypothetical protein